MSFFRALCCLGSARNQCRLFSCRVAVLLLVSMPCITVMPSCVVQCSRPVKVFTAPSVFDYLSFFIKIFFYKYLSLYGFLDKICQIIPIISSYVNHFGISFDVLEILLQRILSYLIISTISLVCMHWSTMSEHTSI